MSHIFNTFLLIQTQEVTYREERPSGRQAHQHDIQQAPDEVTKQKRYEKVNESQE